MPLTQLWHVIPLVALLMLMPMMWHEEHLSKLVITFVVVLAAVVERKLKLCLSHIRPTVSILITMSVTSQFCTLTVQRTLLL
jgi:hypothetical protein